MIYVKPEGPKNARIMLVGEAPWKDEIKEGRPFAGASGYELTTMLRDAGILRSECFITNVVRFKPESDITDFITPKRKDGEAKGYTMLDGFWVAPFVRDHIQQLMFEVEEVNPNVIVTLGNTPLWALTGKTGVTKWRGSLLQAKCGRKLIPVLHPAAILREYSQRAITVLDFKRRVLPESYVPDVQAPMREFIIRPSFETVVQYLTTLLSLLDISDGPVRTVVDIETRKGQIACLGICNSKSSALCIPLLCVEKPEGYWTLEEEWAIVDLLRKVLCHPNIWLVGQNFLYDIQYITKQCRFIPLVSQDTMLWQHTLFPGTPKSLDYLASLYCEHYCYWKDEGKEWHLKVDEDVLWNYNCLDCVYTYEVSEALERAADSLRMRKQIAFQQGLFYPALDMMLRGVAIDKARRTLFANDLGHELVVREDRFKYLLGHPLNPRSAPQMQRLFYNDFRVPPIRKRGSDALTLDDKALTKIADREPLFSPLIVNIQQYRSLGVFKSNFVDAELDPDDRMRCSYNIGGAETFRWSSSENAFYRGTNLQNIPKGEEGKIALLCKSSGPKTVAELVTLLKTTEGKLWDELDNGVDNGTLEVSGRGADAIVSCGLALPNIRSMFVPDPDYFIMDWDLDRADLQVVVWEADDKELKQMLREGIDMHSENAKVLLCTRPIAKRWVHGTNYGGSARTMAINCGITTAQSETMRRRWFAAHPGIYEWHRRTERALAATRSVTNAFGFRRLYFDRLDSILPEALAWVPQSTVALVINTGLRRIYEQLPCVQLMLQVHDSLVMQVHKMYLPSIIPHIQRRLEVVVPYEDPLVIPVSGKGSFVSWGEADKFKFAA